MTTRSKDDSRPLAVDDWDTLSSSLKTCKDWISSGSLSPIYATRPSPASAGGTASPRDVTRAEGHRVRLLPSAWASYRQYPFMASKRALSETG